MENLLEAWQEFVKGKHRRADVQVFERDLMTNLFRLHERLCDGSYIHGSYERFTVSDPKHRVIHKATVTDRVLHRAIYRKLYSIFDPTFIADSYSCRNGKGTHKALDRFTTFARKVSLNHQKTAWVLKCDIRKFFASVDQNVLIALLKRHIRDRNAMWILVTIIRSFPQGLPLGNLTSQLFANVYMDPLDLFVKHVLKEIFYIRYADDFIILHQSKDRLEYCLNDLHKYLKSKLHLDLHPQKIEIRTVASGVDFLGWVHFPDHRVLRTVTKRRMIKSICTANIDSYKGLLQHGNARRLSKIIQLSNPESVVNSDILCRG